MNKILKVSVPNCKFVYYIREDHLAGMGPEPTAGFKLLQMSQFVVDTDLNSLVKCRVSLEHMIDGFLTNEV